MKSLKKQSEILKEESQMVLDGSKNWEKLLDKNKNKIKNTIKEKIEMLQKLEKKLEGF